MINVLFIFYSNIPLTPYKPLQIASSTPLAVSRQTVVPGNVLSPIQNAVSELKTNTGVVD